MVLTNTILLASAGETNVSGTVSDGGSNIASDASAGFTAQSSRNGADPLLAPLANNGGPTPTMALLLGKAVAIFVLGIVIVCSLVPSVRLLTGGERRQVASVWQGFRVKFHRNNTA